MHGHVLVFLKVAVLADIVEVVSKDDLGLPHLHLGHHTRQNPPSNGDMTSKGAFLVNMGALHGPLELLCSIAGVSPC